MERAERLDTAFQFHRAEYDALREEMNRRQQAMDFILYFSLVGHATDELLNVRTNFRLFVFRDHPAGHARRGEDSPEDCCLQLGPIPQADLLADEDCKCRVGEEEQGGADEMRDQRRLKQPADIAAEKNTDEDDRDQHPGADSQLAIVEGFQHQVHRLMDEDRQDNARRDSTCIRSLPI
jgi:hypothetical protein